MSFSGIKRKADEATSPESKKPKTDASITSFFGQKSSPAGPKSTKSSFEASNPPQFDKEKWVASLKPEQKNLLKLEIDTLDPSWLAYLKDDITQPSFLELKRFLQKENDSGKKVFPPPEDIYSWSRYTPLHNVKAVILGQDPYHNNNQAHGLCFSVRPPTPAPPSLKNMYIALAKEYPDFKPPAKNGGLLTPWAEQGVLMINTCLTVRAHEANSHSNKGWEQFTQKIIDLVAKVRTRGVVFLAWGSPAQKRCTKISGAKHLVLKSVHPSPLSASKGFFDCGHFKKTNEFLAQKYGKDGVIDWSLDKEASVDKPAGPVKKEVKFTEEAKKPAPAKIPSGTAAQSKDEFEDEDAMDALKELAASDDAPAVGSVDESENTTETTKEEAAAAVKGENVEDVIVQENKEKQEKANVST